MCVDTSGKKASQITEYIKHQKEEDNRREQLSLPVMENAFRKRKETSNGSGMAVKLTRSTCFARNRGLRLHLKPLDRWLSISFIKYPIIVKAIPVLDD